MDPLALKVAQRYVRAQEDESKDEYSAGHLYYCPDDGTVLLAKRSGIMKHPFKWDVIGGRADAEDDSVEATAVRETGEEIGSLPRDAQLITKKTMAWEKSDGPYQYHVFLYSISADEKASWTPRIVLSKEHTKVKWFKLDELPKEKHLNFDLSWVAAAVKPKGDALTELLAPRYEHKYWVTLDQVPAIREAIRPYVTADDHGLNYEIRNIYLDNEGLEFFIDHMSDEPTHTKLRARTYAAADSEVYLEVKSKTKGICSKVRSVVPRAMYDTLLRTSSTNVSAPFVQLAMQHHSRPILRLDYDREAYNAYEASGRVTIDTNVRYAACNGMIFGEAPTNVLLPDTVGILELKFSGDEPEFMTQLVKRFGLERKSISKYCLSVERMLRSGELKQ